MAFQDASKRQPTSKELEVGGVHPSAAEYQVPVYPRRPRLLAQFVAFLSLFLVYKALSYDTTWKPRSSKPDDWIFEAFGYHGPHRDPGHPSRTQLKEKLYLYVQW